MFLLGFDLFFLFIIEEEELFPGADYSSDDLNYSQSYDKKDDEISKSEDEPRSKRPCVSKSAASGRSEVLVSRDLPLEVCQVHITSHSHSM